MSAPLSDQAWQQAQAVIQAIHQHPFNRELSAGTLSLNKFAYYIEQDTLYLRDFARQLALIAARAPLPMVRDFLSFSEGALIAEQEVVHHFFRETFNLSASEKITPATLAYTSYLLQTGYSAPIEVAIAAVLPCFWVYRDVGLGIAKETASDNPYLRWIETYAGEAFDQTVNKAIACFDTLAARASDEMRAQMIDAFYKSTVLEWHFWNDAYHEVAFDGFV